MKEIERKYLLKSTVLKFLKKQPHTCKDFEQYYVEATPRKSVRYRRAGDRYYKTVKTGKGAIREEKEKEISKKKYRKNLSKRIGYVIRKKRCFLKVEGSEYTIDLFKKPFKGLALMEIEFESEKAYREFTLPEMLRPFVVEDVSEEGTYTNSNLALFGLPLPKKDPQSAIEVLIGKLKKLLKKTQKMQKAVYEKGDDEDLHQLRVSLRTAISLMDRCDLLCEKTVCKEMQKKLKEVISITNQKRDLDVMKAQLEGFAGKLHAPELSSAYEKFLHKIETMQAREDRYIGAYLQSRRFGETMQAYTRFLKHGYAAEETLYARYAVTPVCSYIIYKQFRKIKKRVKTIADKRENELLHKLRIDFKKLRYLLEHFADCYDTEKIKSLLSELKKMQTVLGEFHDAFQQKMIFENLLKEEKESDIRFLIENAVLPRLHTYQEEEIGEIEEKLRRFIRLEKVFRTLFVPPATSKK
jgi:CHAD domain-containing protein/CYTH domain-containing protein